MLWVAVPLFTWAGVGCFIGIARFKYWPLLILGSGYFSWGVSIVLIQLQVSVTTSWWYLITGGTLFVIGTICIFGYRFTFYPKMRARGISPRNLFGFGSK